MYPLSILIDQLFDRIALPRIIDSWYSQVSFYFLPFLHYLQINLFIFQLVALLCEPLNSMVSLFQPSSQTLIVILFCCFD